MTALNKKYGRPGWYPVAKTGLLERTPLVAHYRVVNGSIVSPLEDGYNLAFAEGAVAGDAVRFNAISKGAGIAEVMEGAAIIFDPRNTQEFADTYDRALQMSNEAKRKQTAEVRKRIYGKTIVDWGKNVHSGFSKMRR
jgi:trehalose 6-phosphate synthase